MLKVLGEREMVFEGSVAVLKGWRKHHDKRQMYLLPGGKRFK